MLRLKLRAKKSISLLELMLTMVILSIGLISILRSFFSIAGAINYAQNKIAAIQFLDAKMAGFEEMALEGSKFLEDEFEEDVRLNERDFHWKAYFSPIFYNENEIEGIKEASIIIAWKEANRNKDEKLITYLKLKK